MPLAIPVRVQTDETMEMIERWKYIASNQPDSAMKLGECESSDCSSSHLHEGIENEKTEMNSQISVSQKQEMIQT
jgi:hypothetical protein